MKIYLCETSQLDINDIQTNILLLSDDRQEKIKNKKMDYDKKLSYSAGMALKSALREYGIEEQSAKYTYTEQGKPYIKNKENNIFFNLSHSGECAVATVCEKEVGIDIEKIRSVSENVVKRCFSEMEKQVYDNSLNKENTFFSIWTLKESFLKTTGTGIIFDMSKVETNYSEGDRSVEIICEVNGKVQKAYARVISEIREYIISVCSFEPIENVEIVQMDLNVAKTILEELNQLVDESYREFSTALIPGTMNLLGVRLPELRKIAKRYSKSKYIKRKENNVFNGPFDFDLTEYLQQESEYFEEVMLKGLMIGYATEKDKDVTRALKYLDDFSNHINNWSVCDSFCNTFKVVRNDLNTSWNHIQKYINSNEEFKVRIGLILILNHFIKYDSYGRRIPRKKKITVDMLNVSGNVIGLYEERIINILNRAYDQGYYAMMAAAWTTAEMFVTFPASVYRMLVSENKMDDVTYNKSIQKICESNTPTSEVKEMLKKLKRKL